MKLRIIGFLLALLGSGGGGFLLGHAFADDHARKEGVKSVCPDLLREQHTLFDSIGVTDAYPMCWDFLPSDVQPTIRWRSQG